MGRKLNNDRSRCRLCHTPYQDRLKKKLQASNILWENEWLQVLDDDGWTIYRHTGTNEGICIIVYRQSKSEKEILLRVENIPPHGGMVETSLTGTVEEGEDPLDTCVKELKEESGYSASPSEFISLGHVFTSKASDFKLYLYAVDVTGKTPGDILGDGSEGEKGSSVKWVDEKAVCHVESSPAMAAGIARLNYKLG